MVELSEFSRMLAGEWVNVESSELDVLRKKANELCFYYNTTNPSNRSELARIMAQLLPGASNGVFILPPFQTDYGINCTIGKDTFVNRGCYFMDGAAITIGEHGFIGPSCGLYTAQHPFLAEERNQNYERELPITLGNNVWLGGNVVVLGGVTIGSNSVIGAGSVVTKNIPAGVVAVGNPCRVVRPITEADSIF